jgi:hypothetical protein
MRARRWVLAVVAASAGVGAALAACGGDSGAGGSGSADAALLLDAVTGDAPLQQGDTSVPADAPAPGPEAAADAPTDGPTDAGSDAAVDSPFDAGVTCVGSLGSPPPPPPDAAPLVQPVDASVVGTPLVSSASLNVAGLTTDDLAIYDLGDGVERAIPIDGGPSQIIIAPDPDAGALTSRFVQGHDVVVATTSGQTFAWRPGTTAVRGPTLSGGLSIAGMSADGSRVVAFNSGPPTPTGDGGVSSLCAMVGFDFGAQTSTVLVPPSPSACNVSGAYFSGSTAVFSNGTDVAAYAGPSWTKTAIAVSSFTVDPAVPELLGIAAGTADLAMYPLDGNPATAVASHAYGSGTFAARFTTDATAFLYTAKPSVSVLSTATTASPGASTVLGCFNDTSPNVLSFSPDGAWALLTGVSPSAGPVFWLASTTIPGTPTRLEVFDTGVFSADSKYMVVDGWNAETLVQPVPTGAPLYLCKSTSTIVGDEADCTDFTALTGSKYLFVDIRQSVLFVWDASSAAPPVPVTSLPGNVYTGVSSGKDVVVYSAGDTLYATPLP